MLKIHADYEKLCDNADKVADCYYESTYNRKVYEGNYRCAQAAVGRMYEQVMNCFVQYGKNW